VLRPKEALALMNGTAVMTGLACLAFARADYLLQLATRITALNVVAPARQPGALRRAPVRRQAAPGADASRRLAAQGPGHRRAAAPLHRLQDRYSLRCAPHVLGVLADSLNWLRGSSKPS
jgi:histidine ammonia-lyase